MGSEDEIANMIGDIWMKHFPKLFPLTLIFDPDKHLPEQVVEGVYEIAAGYFDSFSDIPRARIAAEDLISYFSVTNDNQNLIASPSPHRFECIIIGSCRIDQIFLIQFLALLDDHGVVINFTDKEYMSVMPKDAIQYKLPLKS